MNRQALEKKVIPHREQTLYHDTNSTIISGKIPRLMIAAPASGSGKTLITCALLQLLKRQGKKTAAFKCGPDYIDPMFHRSVLGIHSVNLDSYFVKPKVLKELALEHMEGKDIAVMEGVMGLYDGTGGLQENGSSYEIACITDTPVVLVVDAAGMGRSLLALLSGFLQYDRAGLIKGVILNKISEMFYPSIKAAIEKELPLSVLGYFPKQQKLQFGSRHLGLLLPEEIEGLQEKTEQGASVLEKTVDIQGLMRMAQEAPELQTESSSIRPVVSGVKIGVAQDEAFCFYYEDNLRLLQKLGAVLCPFSVLHSEALPEGIQGLLLGGGYPELFAEKLQENRAMRAAVAQAAERGMPILAECGGFLYLQEYLTQDGDPRSVRRYVMSGAAKGTGYNRSGLVRFGYVELSTELENTFLKPGETIRGHEFHYYDSTSPGEDCLACKPSGKTWRCIQAGPEHWWGFPHLYYYSNPEFAAAFLRRAAEYAAG